MKGKTQKWRIDIELWDRGIIYFTAESLEGWLNDMFEVEAKENIETDIKFKNLKVKRIK